MNMAARLFVLVALGAAVGCASGDAPRPTPAPAARAEPPAPAPREKPADEPLVLKGSSPKKGQASTSRPRSEEDEARIRRIESHVYDPSAPAGPVADTGPAPRPRPSPAQPSSPSAPPPPEPTSSGTDEKPPTAAPSRRYVYRCQQCGYAQRTPGVCPNCGPR